MQLSRSFLQLIVTRRPPAPVTEAHPWLGTVGLLALRGDAESSCLLCCVRALPPHVPRVISADTADQPIATKIARRLEDLHAGQVIILPPDPGLRTRAGLIRAVDDRPVPGLNLVARWLAHRLIGSNAGPPIDIAGLGALRDQIQSLALAALDPGSRSAPLMAPRTVRKWLPRLMGCRPSDIRRVLALTRTRRHQDNVERLAGEARTSSSRLRARVRAQLGLSLRDFNALAGWEPVFEAAIQHWGLRLAGSSGRGAGTRGRQRGTHKWEQGTEKRREDMD